MQPDERTLAWFLGNALQRQVMQSPTLLKSLIWDRSWCCFRSNAGEFRARFSLKAATAPSHPHPRCHSVLVPVHASARSEMGCLWHRRFRWGRNVAAIPLVPLRAPPSSHSWTLEHWTGRKRKRVKVNCSTTANNLKKCSCFLSKLLLCYYEVKCKFFKCSSRNHEAVYWCYRLLKHEPLLHTIHNRQQYVKNK